MSSSASLSSARARALRLSGRVRETSPPCLSASATFKPVARAASRSESLEIILSRHSPEGPHLVIIGVGRRPPVIDEVSRIERRGNHLELEGRLGEVEAIGKVVGREIGVAERWKPECRLDEFQDAAEIMRYVGDVGGLGVG